MRKPQHSVIFHSVAAVSQKCTRTVIASNGLAMEKSSTGCAAFGISDAIINYLIELVTALNKA